MSNDLTKPMDRQRVRLAMLGMVKGNGHPYSWSAILNGYDPDVMAKCPFPRIATYLGKEPRAAFKDSGAQVTHIWTDDPADAREIARTCFIPTVVDRPEDVIGKVDAVVIPTDKGHEHVARCRPFVEANLPVFVDKPMVDNEADLRIFCGWVADGAKILSTSCMRYCKEYLPYRLSTNDLGILKFATAATSNSWEQYGIHALEGVYPIVGPGFSSVRNVGSIDRNIVHLKHKGGTDVVIIAIEDMRGSDYVLTLCGSDGHAETTMRDMFYAFRAQLLTFVDYVRTGVRPFPFEETIELMKIIIAGIRSREANGREVMLAEIGHA